MRDLDIDGVARKDERVSVPFDSETYEWLEKMAEQEERPTARQVTLYVKAVRELIDDQGFRLVEGKLRRVTATVDEEIDY
jgi:hypothetical protein